MEQQKITTAYGSCLCTFYNNGRANVMIIDVFEIQEKFRGKGHGKELMKKALSLAKKKTVDSVELLVNPTNIVAKSLYKKAGMKKVDKEVYRLLL